MNISGNETIIDKRSGKILIESEIINRQENIWLKELLKENDDNSVNIEQYEKLDNSQKTFLKSPLYQDLYKSASDEWIIDHVEDSEEKVSCSLCGQKDTKKKYYIKNKINEKMLNVGSTCIYNFRDIRDINGKTADEINKEWKIQQRKKILNDEYNGIIEKIDSWYRKIDEIPTIIVDQLENEYDIVYDQLQKKYEKFIKNKKVDYELASQINELVCQGEKILEKIYADVESKKNDEWKITKEIKEWCYKDREKNKIVIDFLKKDGILSWKSVCRIYEIDLVNKIIEKFKKIFANYDILILGYDERNKTIMIKIVDGNPFSSKIILEYNYEKFLKEYGGLIFNNESVDNSQKQLIVENAVINEWNSIYMCISNIQYLLNKKDLRIYDWNEEYNEVVFNEFNKNNLIIVNAKKFINKFINYAYIKKISEVEYDDLKKYIMSNGEKISKEDYDNRIDIREKAEKSTQVDYNKFA